MELGWYYALGDNNNHETHVNKGILNFIVV